MQYKDFATKEEELKVMRFYQNDLNSAKLLINVTHDKVVTDFSTATKVQIAFLKPDGKRVFQEVQNVNQMQGKYYVVLSTQTLIAYGNVIAQLRLTFPNNKVIETCKFVFAVDESIMSDEAMASTNEFPVIQKALELGEKFKDVDFDPIINAGALAAGALPKTGGTMTGTMAMANTKGIDFLTPNSKFTLATSTSEASPNRMYMFDSVNQKTVIDYNANNGGLFTINGDTNLFKKAGGEILGDILIDRPSESTHRNIVYTTGGVRDVSLGQNTSGKFHAWDQVGNNGIWEYDKATKSFNVTAPNTNLLKTTGGTMTGELVLSSQATLRQRMPATASARGFRYQDETSQAFVAGLGFYRSSDADKGACYMGWGDTPWSQATSLSVGENVFKYKGKDIAFADKNGRATITLTADAELISPNAVFADRRGNTVTLRAPIRRKLGSTNSAILFTLPVDMRPTLILQYSIPATDGVPGIFTINTNGEVTIQDALTVAPVAGKNFYATCTYVVD
ncbi:BppU family phage baseplate upper protein [Bacillus albus]